MAELGLVEIFNTHQKPDITRPPSRDSHDYEVVAIAPISKTEWEKSVWRMAMKSKNAFGKAYDNYDREMRSWLGAVVEKEHIDDRSLSALVQIYTGSRAPVGNMMILSGSNSFIDFLLKNKSKHRAKDKVGIPDIKNYINALKGIPDNSLSAIILDYGLSNMVDPLLFFDLIAKKLSPQGMYCHIDRKAYKDFPDRYFEAGIARILEDRKVVINKDKTEHFFIPKIFIRDLSGQMRNRELVVVFDTSNDPRFTYQILLGVKSPTKISLVRQEELVESGWNQLESLRQKLRFNQ